MKRIDESFWLPHLRTPEAVRYARLRMKIANAVTECKTIRDRAYQRARRQKERPE